jgi:ADP-heptose:LPS heptosyltransferase
VVVRALRGLGDMLCAVPALRALRAALPSARLALITLAHHEALFERYPGLVDELLAFPGFPGIPEASVAARRTTAFLAEVQTRRFDLAIQLHGSGAFTNQFSVLLGAGRTAGFCLPSQFRPDEELFLTYPTSGLEVDRLLALMEHLGARDQGRELQFPLGPGDAAGLRVALGGAPPPAASYAVVHPGAEDPRRRWPAERFAAVGRQLRSAGLRVLVTGTASEHELTARVAASCDGHDLGGRTTLGALAALLADARLLVSNDTGVAHLADALRVPSVVVFSFSEAARWGPRDARLHRVVAASHLTQGAFDSAAHCLGDACLLAPWNERGYGRPPEVEQALQALEELLAETVHPLGAYPGRDGQ